MPGELEALRDWKRSALVVLAEWEAVFDAAGRPGPVGRSKAANTNAEVLRLRAENSVLAAALADRGDGDDG
ncbi:hypothetical protein [Desertimonas flava]|uniref:hypothetical protein n=1 Tax=Desertimonas flava TaxID=2064846 RepID=UPI000E344515|nr:hypothetical protein [Desertimonas flava]